MWLSDRICWYGCGLLFIQSRLGFIGGFFAGQAFGFFFFLGAAISLLALFESRPGAKLFLFLIGC